MRVFSSSAVDPRVLSMPSHKIAGVSASERQRIHGRIVPMDEPRSLLKRMFGR